MDSKETFDEKMDRFAAARKTPRKGGDNSALIAALRELARKANSATELIALADADERFEPGMTVIDGVSDWTLTIEEQNEPGNTLVYLATGQRVEGKTEPYSYRHCVPF